MQYIYLINLPDGNIYVGQHKWDGNGLDPHYFGSGHRLATYKVRDAAHYGNCSLVDGSTVSLLEDCSSMSIKEYNNRETYWILHYAQLYGVVPFWGNCNTKSFAVTYCRPDGRLLNCHSNPTPDNARYEWYVDDTGPFCWCDIDNFYSSTISRVWSRYKHPDSFYWNGYHIHKLGCTGGPKVGRMYNNGHSKESALLSLQTRIESGAHQRALDSAHSAESRAKAVSTMQSNNMYVQSTQAAIASAWRPEVAAKRSATRKSRRPLYTNGEFTGDFEQIAAYIGYPYSSRIVSDYLKGSRSLPAKWSILREFHLVSVS